MTQDTPSPLPWQIDDDGDIVDANNRLALDGGFSRPDTLSRVVRAVNREPAFAAMMEALEPFALAVDCYPELSDEDVLNIEVSDLRRARTALALAEERE